MGSSRSAPTSTVTSQVRQEYPEFFQPYLEDVLESSQEQFAREYDPFPEARLVETPQVRKDALTSLQDTGLAKMSQQGYADAIKGTKSASTAFPETNLSSYMNPYQDLVTDQLLRNAKERRDIKRKSIGDQAARVGAFGGSRQAVTESLFDRDTQRELTDLEERSQMANFANALAASSADKERALKGSQQLAGLSQAQQAALTSGLVGVEKAATAEQAINQQIRDVAFQEFMDQSNFDQQKLAEYSAIIRGATPPANQFITKETSTPKSGLQQVAGLGSIASGLFGGGGGGGGLFSASGGVVDYKRGGVADYKQEKTTEDVVDSAIKKLAGIGSGNIEMGSGQRALKKVTENIAPKKDEIKFTEEEITVEGGGLQNLMPNDGGQFDMATLVEQGNEDMMMPQQQQLAYGGVPGQAYTEDIGMMGGLASVAGPQMRFAEGDRVADSIDIGFDPSGDRARKMGLDYNPDFDEYVKKRKQGASPYFLGMSNPSDEKMRQEFIAQQNRIRRGMIQDARKQTGTPKNLIPNVESLSPDKLEVKEKVEDVTVNESGFGDDVNETVFGEMEMKTQPQAPKKKPEVKTPLPTKKKPVGESELAKYLKTLERDQGLSSRDKVAMGLALLTGREEGLTQASRAVAAGKGPASDLEVELKAIQASNETEANKAKLAETLRKRAADRAKRTLEATKTGIEIQKLKLDISKSDDQAAIKLWESAGIIGQNELLKITEEERKTMTPELYAQKIRQAVASLKPRR
jgi:hypothetical protein